MRRVLASLILLATCDVPPAPLPGLSGRVVVDTAAGRLPLPGARVQVFQGTLGTETDGDGRFLLEALPVGLYRLQISGVSEANPVSAITRPGLVDFLRDDLGEIHTGLAGAIEGEVRGMDPGTVGTAAIEGVGTTPMASPCCTASTRGATTHTATGSAWRSVACPPWREPGSTGASARASSRGREGGINNRLIHPQALELGHQTAARLRNRETGRNAGRYHR